jgi:hypothetical protein
MKPAITLAVLITLAFDLPAIEHRQTTVCSGMYSNAQCCATNVLDLADLNCTQSYMMIPIDPVWTGAPEPMSL